LRPLTNPRPNCATRLNIPYRNTTSNLPEHGQNPLQPLSFDAAQQVPKTGRKITAPLWCTLPRSEVVLRETSEALFAEIDVQPSFLGKLLTILYKPPELRISVSIADGRNKEYRFVPGMARAGLFLSPLIEDTIDFLFLTATNREYLAKKIVKGFTISAVNGKSRNKFQSIGDTFRHS
jgi:hypothetical protein